MQGTLDFFTVQCLSSKITGKSHKSEGKKIIYTVYFLENMLLPHGQMRARNSTALTVVDILHTVFIEPQVEQDAEKQDIQ